MLERARRFGSVYRLRGRIGAALVCWIAAVACGPPVAVRPVDAMRSLRDERARAFDEGRLSRASRATLRDLGIDRVWRDDPESVFQRLFDGEVPEHDPNACRLLLGELALLEADRAAQRGNLERAARWYLMATLAAQDEIAASPQAADGGGYMSTLYGHALGQYLELRSRFDSRVLQLQRFRFAGWDFEVTFDDDCVNCFPHDYFDSLVPSREIELLGALKQRHRRVGLGAAMTGIRENDHRDPIDRWKPQEGIFYPATGMIRWDRPGDRSRRARLRLHRPRNVPTTEFLGEPVTLAADFTAPYGLLLSRAELKRLGLRGLRNPERLEDRRGLYLMEPYDPDKTPLIMVHGLFSSPATWIELTHALNGDEELRGAYQVWHYFYPTGVPWLEAARYFRAELEELRAFLDPDDTHLATHEMVVIGHSMGGLLTKTLVSDSHDWLWNRYFSVPPDQLDVEVAIRAALRETFFFEPRRYVRRVVFVSTPHRGSDMADSFLGRLGSTLARLPGYFSRRLQAVLTRNREKVHPEVLAFQERAKISSVRLLSPDYPGLQAFADLAVDPSIPFHTLVGNRGRDLPLEQSSDGVVDYWSSHLEHARSEFVVPSGHDAHIHPEGIVELRRILREHLFERFSPLVEEPIQSPFADEDQSRLPLIDIDAPDSRADQPPR